MSRHCNAENAKKVKKITIVFCQDVVVINDSVMVKNRIGAGENADIGLLKTIGEGKNLFSRQLEGR